jgi:hypothetical protein
MALQRLWSPLLVALRGLIWKSTIQRFSRSAQTHRVRGSPLDAMIGSNALKTFVYKALEPFWNPRGRVSHLSKAKAPLDGLLLDLKWSFLMCLWEVNGVCAAF